MKRSLLAVLAGAILAAGLSLPALAHDRWHRGDHWYGGPRVSLDVNIWRGGFWRHGWYGPRFGWWWVVPSAGYYYYDAPAYPYPDYYRPSTVVIERDRDAVAAPPAGAPQQQYWYYCREPDGYYPYVPECHTQWRQVPVTPQGAPPSPPPGKQ